MDELKLIYNEICTSQKKKEEWNTYLKISFNESTEEYQIYFKGNNNKIDWTSKTFREYIFSILDGEKILSQDDELYNKIYDIDKIIKKIINEHKNKKKTIIHIPTSLQNPEFRFILLGKWDEFAIIDEKTKFKTIKRIPGKKSKKELDELKEQKLIAQGKVPIEMAWQNSNNYRFDNETLLKYIAEGYNYGIATGFGNLAILDDDTPNKELTKLFDEKIGETFEVKTGSGGIHKYIIVKGMTKKIIFYNKDGHHMGELQWKTQQCVGPNSKHPTGEEYKIHKDIPILEVQFEKLAEVFKEFIPIKEKVIREHILIEWDGEKIQNIPITNIVSTVGLNDMGDGCYQGNHPQHGSTGGMNFRINTKDNTWFCFRCRSGGGASELIGVVDGIISCNRAGKHCFTEDEARRVIQIAREKYGLKTPEKNNIYEIITQSREKRKGLEQTETKAKKALEQLQKSIENETKTGLDEEGETPGTLIADKELSETEKEEVSELKKGLNEEIVELFTDIDGVAYATISINGHQENIRINSTIFKNFVIKTIYDRTNKPPSKSQLDNIIAIFAIQAQFEGKVYEVHLRAARVNDKLYIDLCDEKWNSIEISPEEIKILKNPLVKFKRYKHMKEMVFDLDAKIKDIDLLWKYIPIHEEDKKVLAPHIALLLIPDIPYAMLIVYGSQGSGKSFCLKLLRQIIDPSSLKLLSLAKDKTELYQQLGHHYLPIFDNVTSLNKEYSDLFCKVVTGEGFSKRQLYTDDDDVIYNFIRKLGFNGINLAGEEPDFLDRSVPINLSRIPRSARKTEAQILKEFEKDRPKITGAIFKIIQKTIPLVPKIETETKLLPRMADYAIWCEAASQVLGADPGVFIDNFFGKIDGLNKEAIEANPIASSIIEFMKDKKEWDGVSSQFLNQLNQVADNLQINTRQPIWPKSPNILRRKINDIKSNLEDSGLQIFFNRNKDSRTIFISKQKALSYKEEIELQAQKKLVAEVKS